jgi:hypothetical protein
MKLFRVRRVRPFQRLIRAALATGAAAALLACAGGVQPGMSRGEVVSRLGSPTRSVALPTGGERLQYSSQPAGQQAVMVDLAPDGRVVQSRQVLNETDLGRIGTAGDWTRADVEREFGPPASVGHVASWNGPILTYRWRGGGVDQVYSVYLDGQGVVRRARTGMDPAHFRDRR